jgi:hypothetical protein
MHLKTAKVLAHRRVNLPAEKVLKRQTQSFCTLSLSRRAVMSPIMR